MIKSYKNEIMGVSLNARQGFAINKRLWKKRINSATAKALSVLFGLFLAAVLGGVVTIGYDSFFDKWDLKIQSPVIIKIQAPIVIEDRIYSPLPVRVVNPTNTPIPTIKKVKEPVKTTVVPEAPSSEYELIHSKKNGQILWIVYALESSRGKNDICRAKGMYNGFGYMKTHCYATFEEVVTVVDNWFTDHLEKHSLATALCGYNLGFNNSNLDKCLSRSADYPYYRDFLTIRQDEFLALDN